MKAVENLTDDQAFRKSLDELHGSLNGGFRAATNSRGAPALDVSMHQVSELQKAALGSHFIKAEIDSTDAPMSGVGDYRLSPLPFLRNKPRVANLIPTEPPEAPAVFYFKGTTAASAAAPVVEGAAKPESSPVWTQVSAPVRKIAHYTRINDEVLADFTNFRQVIGTELLAASSTRRTLSF
jgi:hypothetical protein